MTHEAESTSAVYRRCAAAVEKAIAAIQENPSLYRSRAARNKLVELAAAAKQLDRQLGGYDRDDEDHFGEAFAAAALDMRAADVDALAACAAAAEDGGGDALLEASPVEAGEIESPTVFSTAVSRRVNLEELKKIKKQAQEETCEGEEAGAEEKTSRGGAAALRRDRDAAGRPGGSGGFRPSGCVVCR